MIHSTHSVRRVGLVLLGAMLWHAPVAYAERMTETGLPETLATKANSFAVTEPGAAPIIPMKAPSGPSGDQPVTMEADAMAYDKEQSIAIARGHVTVVQGENVLTADQLTYYQKQNIVVAEGNVSVLQSSGEVYFADQAELKDNMEQGIVRAFKSRLADDAVFAADTAEKVNKAVTVMKQAVYTPCHVCDDMAPFWQVKASDMRVDQANEEITYHDARMEMRGIPIFYTPYLSQPTPDAEAQSGLLTPQYSSDDKFGRKIKQPYYWRMGHDKELLLTPWFMSEEAPLIEGEYKQLSDGGAYEALFSATNPQKRDGRGNPTEGHEFRGHIYAKGQEALTDYSRVGFDINRTTDDTYLRRYAFGSERFLFSRAYAEAAQGRNYALAQSIAVQGQLATDDPDTIPFVLPVLEGYYETAPSDYGVRYHASANAQHLDRTIGASQQRLSVTAGATLPYVTDGGQLITTTANVRQDIYQMENVAIPGEPTFDGSKQRTLPQLAVEWRYPLIRPMEHAAMTVEPIALAVAQPEGGNPVEINNEDNTLIELTDTNLFSLNRMPGLDTVDNGTRFAYGMRSQYLFTGGEAIDGLFGQNYSLNEDTPFPNSTRAGQHYSDYIGRIGFDAAPVNFTYGFALDSDSFDANRSEVTTSFREEWLNLIGIYRSIKNNRYLENSEEATLYADTPITDAWTVYATGRRNLILDQMIAARTGLIYHNECFSLTLEGLRTYARDRDIEPDTQFTFRVGFKNLGEFGD